MTALEQIGPLADVPIELEMELDRKIMPLCEILQWEPGRVVWLTRSAGEAIDIHAGGALIGLAAFSYGRRRFARPPASGPAAYGD